MMMRIVFYIRKGHFVEAVLTVSGETQWFKGWNTDMRILNTIKGKNQSGINYTGYITQYNLNQM